MLAITAHAAAHGGTPDAPLTLLLTVLIGWIATSLADRAAGIGGILLTLGAGQLVMHQVFTLVDDHHAGAVVSYDPIAIGCAHALATGLTALLLEHADRALLAVTSGLRRLFVVLWSRPTVSVPIGSIAVLPGAQSLYVETQLRRVRPRRGPPVRV